VDTTGQVLVTPSTSIGITAAATFGKPKSCLYLAAVSARQQNISEFGEVLLFIIGGILFLVITFLVSRLIRPDRPSLEKLSTYESGEEATGSAWTQFNIRFYVIAIIFLLFEVEIVLLFPWSVVFANKQLIEQTNGAWGWLTVTEAVIFIGVLALGLVYAWGNDHLEWIKPDPKPTVFQSPVPPEFYQRINQQYSDVKGVRMKSDKS
jgi:NADH-quinone oxidoreductase subunit A